MKPDAHGGGHRILPGVQYLRGWAAILVVLSHVDGMMGKERYFGAGLVDAHLIGVFGVSIFFCLSGFIIALVSLNERLEPKIDIATYARRRFDRIIPFLWLCVLGYNILHAVAADFELGPALRAFLIWPVGELRPNVVWSLRHELLFYLLFAWTMLLPRRRFGFLAAWCMAPLVALPLLPTVTAALGPNYPQLLELYQVVLGGSDVGANLQFGAGLLLAFAYLRGSGLTRERLARGPWLCLIAVALGALAVEVTQVPVGLGRALLWTSLAAPILLLALVIVDPAKGVLHRTGLLLGNASFSIYLTHNPLLLMCLEASRFVPGLNPIMFAILSSIVAVSGGILIHLWVESPLLRLVSRRRVPAAAVDGPAIHPR